MPRPQTTAEFSLEAISQMQQAFEDALVAQGVGGGTPQAFTTGEVAIAAAPTITQLPAQASATGFLVRVENDVYVNSANSPAGGQLLYEGDDLEFRSVTDLDQLYVLPLKNQATVLRWSTL